MAELDVYGMRVRGDSSQRPGSSQDQSSRKGFQHVDGVVRPVFAHLPRACGRPSCHNYSYLVLTAVTSDGMVRHLRCRTCVHHGFCVADFCMEERGTLRYEIQPGRVRFLPFAVALETYPYGPAVRASIPILALTPEQQIVAFRLFTHVSHTTRTPCDVDDALNASTVVDGVVGSCHLTAWEQTGPYSCNSIFLSASYFPIAVVGRVPAGTS